MPLRLELRARDVTLLPETRPAPDPAAAPERQFSIAHDANGFTLTFDGRQANVPNDHILDLLSKVSAGTSVEWRHSTNPEIQATFRPLNRILMCINSTPSYQLFLAGFHIADAIGVFDFGVVQRPAIDDSFRYLVGNLPWQREGKKGALFVLPEGYVQGADVILELMANGKLFSADLYSGDQEPNHHVENKLFVPYATPMGFNTRVTADTEVAWRRVSELIQRQRGA